MTADTHTPSGWSIGSALRAAVHRVVDALRTAVEVYDEGRALEARTLASLDDRAQRNIGIDPHELRYWRNADKTLSPVATDDRASRPSA